MKHLFTLFMLFALASTELTAKPVSSRKSKMRKKGARKSRKVSNRKKRTSKTKTSGKVKPKVKQKGKTSTSSKRKRGESHLKTNLNLSTSSNLTVGVLPKIDPSTELPENFNAANAEPNWRSITKSKNQYFSALQLDSPWNDVKRSSDNWLITQQEVGNNGIAGDNSGFNCGVMSIFSHQLDRRQVAVKIATTPESASVYLSGASDSITSFSQVLKSYLKYWTRYSTEAETIEGITINKKEMIASLEAALSWSQKSQPSDGGQKEKNTQEFLEDFFNSSEEAKGHEKNLHQALILAPNPNVTCNKSEGLCLRSDKNDWCIMETMVGQIFPYNNYLRACAILAKANILVFSQDPPYWTLVPHVNSNDPQSVIWDTVVIQHKNDHYTHYEPKGNREGVKANEQNYNLGNKSPHALYKLDKIPFADLLLNEMHENYKKIIPNNKPDTKVDSSYSEKLSKTIETLRQKISKTPPEV